MQFVGKLVTSVSDFYRDLNPATLTGAMDVIVVEDTNSKERACTPFHVRIGKLNLMRPQDKRVEVQVNGEVITGVEMKVGEAGEAFFVVPEEDLLVSDAGSGGEDDLSVLSTSPLPPPPLSPPQRTHEDHFTLSPKKATHKPPSLSDHTLSDTELDYTTCQYEMWVDVFEYLGREDRVRIQLSEMNVQPQQEYSLTLYSIPWPLQVHPPRDYPMVIEQTVQGHSLQLSQCIGDLQRFAMDPSLQKHVILSVNQGQWWFAGRHAILMAVCLGVFKQVPDVEQSKHILFPPLPQPIHDVSSKKQQQPTTAPSSWRHWWSRSSPDAPTAAPSVAPTLVSTPPIAIPTPTSQPQPQTMKKRFLKSLRLTSQQLASLPLKAGPNSITFTFATGRSCQSRIFLWPSDSRIVISDIDGTITKSDAWGHILTFVGKDWTHSGVAGLFDRIHKNGYRFLYLTARAIGQAGSTRDYLRGVEQDKCQLPEGPVIMSPDRLLAALRREVIIGNPEEFKIACLKDIKRLFNNAEPFYAGFGNRFTDAQSYHAVGIPTHRIFTVEPGGELRVEHGVGYASTYSRMLDVADLFFPPYSLPSSRDAANEEAFQDFNFWRMPVQPVDDLAAFLPPPQSTAVIAGDNIIIIEDGSLNNGNDNDSETGSVGPSELEEEEEKEYPFL